MILQSPVFMHNALLITSSLEFSKSFIFTSKTYETEDCRQNKGGIEVLKTSKFGLLWWIQVMRSCGIKKLAAFRFSSVHTNANRKKSSKNEGLR